MKRLFEGHAGSWRWVSSHFQTFKSITKMGLTHVRQHVCWDVSPPAASRVLFPGFAHKLQSYSPQINWKWPYFSARWYHRLKATQYITLAFNSDNMIYHHKRKNVLQEERPPQNQLIILLLDCGLEAIVLLKQTVGRVFMMFPNDLLYHFLSCILWVCIYLFVCICMCVSFL